MKPVNKYEHWMRIALGLARRGEGLTRPNPPVGAIVVKNEMVIGAGFHRCAGGDHAEIIALKKAGARAKGAQLYITLEPCCTYGRTPPCVHVIIKSGIRTVITSVPDPNPRHKGRGIFTLKKAGIKVVEGVCRNEGQELIEPFKKWILSGKPYLSLKMAMSYDGKTADYQGKSRWITGKKARSFVHDMRRRVDAVLVGAGTVLADNPCLLPKSANGRKTYRIILDAKGRVSPDAKVLCDSAAKQTIMATTSLCPAKRRNEWLKNGAQVWIIPSRQGQVSIPALMDKIGGIGLLHVLCEGGSETAASLIRAGMVDEFLFFFAPLIIGGKNALPAIGGKGWQLSKSPRLSFIEWQIIGNDILIRAKPRK
ncbi:MAG: bifunctional diaminohydroxyphosphoribosylaminopyrimidine deaminase/5-amino-6-(5-phosphoribosylamino)uracil reductase RibD [Kiritimatiellia bacterium]|nr:bifunctional diaminohydroxyphosphoribosylaminopyrimidine deaminase/5-amino-6-(5-phosphoribosylamino)uracil reductase RibD [Kiritimatiellia bacterium]